MISKTSAPGEPPNLGTALKRFSQPRAIVEACELCGLELAPAHEHVVEIEASRLLCVCGACAVLFGGAATKYRRVGRSVSRIPNPRVEDAEWKALGIPVNLAFLFQRSTGPGMFAVYPSPGGPTEVVVDEQAWADLLSIHPTVSPPHADVEALLVNRLNGAADWYLAPVDECYRLVGLVRQHWRGFSGGAEAWRVIDEFFLDLARRSK